MNFEETLGALLESKLAPLREELGKVTAELEAIRRKIPPALVTIPEAADRLGISVATVRRRVRDGSLKSTRIGRSVRIDLAGANGVADGELAEVLSLIQR